MTIKYSASARGFFDTSLHRDIPADAVNVSPKRHAELFAGQAEGKEIIPNDRGRPVLSRPKATTIAEVRAACVNAIKREAARRIDKRMPLWRQINALRDGTDPGFHEIDLIRAASNLIEDHLKQVSDKAQLLEFPVATHPIWPAFDQEPVDA